MFLDSEKMQRRFELIACYHFEFSASYQIQLIHSRGEQWIRLKGNFGENEDIKVEATMFDGSIPVSKAGGPGQDVKLHISLVINIHKGDGEVLEFLCSAWPNSIEITNLFVQGNNKKPSWPCLISVLNSTELETSTETTYFGQRLKDLFVLLCCEDSLLLYSLKSVIQGDSNPIQKVNLSCCWTTTFKKNEKKCGLVVLYRTDLIEIRVTVGTSSRSADVFKLISISLLTSLACLQKCNSIGEGEEEQSNVEEADQYKAEFYRKRFYDEADKNYWKAIAELLPNEVSTIEINKGNKDHEKKPPIIVIFQCPKPGNNVAFFVGI
ncbi:hypothetical protein EZV62_003639 [Acer yangbiense]|uniref:Uncharacterized protein n=1 Tax=Acer yangbiense TaxID=1000413 RepID=A0A5C7II93_9ROSI|nr:hypothetical protein EZV62_003639 [Acer yangbiense]